MVEDVIAKENINDKIFMKALATEATIIVHMIINLTLQRTDEFEALRNKNANQTKKLMNA